MRNSRWVADELEFTGRSFIDERIELVAGNARMLEPREYWIYLKKAGSLNAEGKREWVDAAVRSQHGTSWFIGPHRGIRYFPYVKPGFDNGMLLGYHNAHAIHDVGAYRFTTHDAETGFPRELSEKGTYVFKPGGVDESNREFVGACYVHNDKGTELRSDVGVDQRYGGIGVRRCYAFDPVVPEQYAVDPAPRYTRWKTSVG